MVILEVYSKCLKVKYKTRLCSKATIFTLLTNILSIIIPFIFAYNSRGFWLKHDTFYEQPNVRFRGEYLFSAITNNVSSPVICSNFPYFQEFAQFDKCSLIKAREIDNNKDGKVDEIEFNLNIEAEDFTILSFYLMLTFDYSLQTVCPLIMQSAIITQHQFNRLNTTEINIVANLGLSQLSPLPCHPKWKYHVYNYSVVQNGYGSYSYDIKNIMLNYIRRNISTHLINEYTTFSTDYTNSELAVKLKVRLPEHQVYFVPEFWQVIKWAWIQYFALYIVVAWFMQKIRNYVFENNLILFYEVSPLKKVH